MKKKRKWTFKLFVKLPLLFIALSFALVLLLRYVPVYYTPLMLKRSIENRKVESFKTQHKWVSLDQISPQLAKAVVMTEDQKFYTHNGFDWEEIKKMREYLYFIAGLQLEAENNELKVNDNEYNFVL